MNPLRKAEIIASSSAVAIGAAAGAMALADEPQVQEVVIQEDLPFRVDTIVMPWGEVRIDTIVLTTAPSIPVNSSWRTEAEHAAHVDSAARYRTLTDSDYRIVASQLGVETAAIKAVVRIEAGAALEGFWAPGVPIINFDRSMYARMKPTSTQKAPASAAIPQGISSSYGRQEWSQLIAARKVNMEKANMGTFWGMFQIGGFNWKICGCKDVEEFVERMSFSEFEQLELFAEFIKNSGMLPLLKAKNWAGFARRYNGPSYAKRGYHTKMANAYARFKSEESRKSAEIGPNVTTPLSLPPSREREEETPMD